MRLGRLVRDRRTRDEASWAVVEGPRSIATALGCGARVVEAYARPDRIDDARRLFGNDTVVEEVDGHVLDRLADTDSPQGVMAVVERSDAAPEVVGAHRRVVVLDGIQDPGNAGAVVRTAAAAGFGAVVAGTGTADLWSPRAIRASAGAVFALDVVRRVETASVLAVLGAAGHRRVGAVAGGAVDSEGLVPEPMMTLVLGSEGHGLSVAVLEAVDLEVSVPMADPVESLNVAVTAGILMYRMR